MSCAWRRSQSARVQKKVLESVSETQLRTITATLAVLRGGMVQKQAAEAFGAQQASVGPMKKSFAQLEERGFKLPKLDMAKLLRARASAEAGSGDVEEPALRSKRQRNEEAPPEARATIAAVATKPVGRPRGRPPSAVGSTRPEPQGVARKPPQPPQPLRARAASASDDEGEGEGESEGECEDAEEEAEQTRVARGKSGSEHESESEGDSSSSEADGDGDDAEPSGGRQRSSLLSRVTRAAAATEEEGLAGIAEEPADAYFSAQRKHSGVALGKLLSALPGASDPELLRASLRELATTERGRLSANQLRELRGRHARWLALLRSGHNVLLHGAGSKRAVLEQLRTEVLAKTGSPVVVVHGYAARARVRSLLQLVCARLGMPAAAAGGSVRDACALIKAALRRGSELKKARARQQDESEEEGDAPPVGFGALFASLLPRPTQPPPAAHPLSDEEDDDEELDDEGNVEQIKSPAAAAKRRRAEIESLIEGGCTWLMSLLPQTLSVTRWRAQYVAKVEIELE